MGDEYERYFNVGQQAAVRSVLTMPEGATLAVNLPTGSGKSLCAQLPAAMGDREGRLTVVVVPTVALALDQEEAVRSIIGHDAAYHGGNSSNEAIRERIRNGTQRLVFASPEGLLRSLAPAVFQAARRGFLRQFVIDEAHVVVEWGNDFRSAFQDLAGMRQGLLDACETPFTTLLLSATFMEETMETLETLFGRPGPFDQVVATRLRPEPSYWWKKVAGEDEKKARVLEALRHLPRPLILYASCREDVRLWAGRLHEAGYRRWETLTGASSSEHRRHVLDRWRADAVDIVAATSAFGLGVDKADVRAVVHACVPENVNRFYQEVGRGGRDGNASVSLLVYTSGDLGQAKGINRETVLKPGTAFGRWKAMYDERKVLDEHADRYRVPVTATTGIDMSNETNKDWNIRTLILMHRAGLIHLEGEPPPQQHEIDAEGDSVAEEAMLEKLRAYHDHRVIQLDMAAPRHEANFEERVSELRENMNAANRRGFRDMTALLGGEECVADVLLRVYRVPRDGGGRPVAYPVAPVDACGGCPACRRTNAGRRTRPLETVGVPGWTHGARALHPALRTHFENGDRLAVFHEPDDRTHGWDRTVRRFARWCVERGLRRVTAPPAQLDAWGDAWSRRRLRVFLSELRDEPPDPSSMLDVPDLVYLPEGRALPRHYLNAVAPRILLLPWATVHPRRAPRRVWDVLKATKFRFCSFQSLTQL